MKAEYDARWKGNVMTHRELTQFLMSLPPRGGEKERLRQDRILQSIDAQVKSSEEAEISEMHSLEKKLTRTPEEEKFLSFLQQKFPEEATALLR